MESGSEPNIIATTLNCHPDRSVAEWRDLDKVPTQISRLRFAALEMTINMLHLSIVKLTTPSLRERSKEVDRDFLLLSETQKFIDDMIPTMYGDDGIGLAAPQVANNIRICIIGKQADKSLGSDLVLVNHV